MKNVIGITIALGLVTSGVVAVVKSRNEQKAEERQVAARKAFGDKLRRSIEVAADVREQKRIKDREERQRAEATPEGRLKKELIMAGSWIGLQYDFNNEVLLAEALDHAEQQGYIRNGEAIVPYLVTSLRAKERHPTWSAEQHDEVGKIAVTAMKCLGDNYHQNAVFLVVDDFVGFEILNQDNRNAVTAIIASYASKKASHRRWAA